ncbi:hypothetical protein J3Q64DRAFT_1629430 [Phycomyces blakesleeanus]|uniref:UBA domain-containing protein n=1 Tax=Phycomyces blakesleeanus TaxID=4837 RepID=A0ABR3BCX0_PHYBL
MNQQAKLDFELTTKADNPTKNLRNGFIEDYQANTLQYHTKPEEDIFPRAYHTLVHCPISAIFNTLLELEQNYGLSIQAHFTAFEQELVALQAIHSRDIDPSFSPSNMTHHINHNHNQQQQHNHLSSLFARHTEEMEVLQATWASDLLQTQQTQRQEYRDFVIELYREYQLRLASLTDENNLKPEDTLAMAEKKLDGKEIIAAAAGRIPQWANNSKNKDIPNSSASTESKEKALFQKMVSDIQEMGFPKEMAETALSLCHQNMEQAIAMLLENPQKLQLQLQQQQQHLQLQQQQQQQNLPFLPQTPLQRPMLSNASSPAHSRNSSWNEMPSTPTTAAGANNGSGLASNRRHSTQKIATAPAFLHLSGNKNNTNNSSNANTSTTTSSNKAWNPISFLQQQKQAMENTNLSSVRKLGGWLGKAMENLGIENDESDPRFSQESSASGFHNSQQLVESFTITLGTAQIKSTHNLRLLVADLASDILNPLPYDGPREMAYRAQTATNLYSTHLNAMIVLVELSELKQASLDDNIGWRNYKTGKGSNKALFERCQHSTEFHFPNIESQLSTIEADFNKYPDHLQEGCFFITRHSNLPLTQTVFHLVIDSDGKHNLITGLRNILRLVTRFDISSLSIPLLLLPDRYLEQPEYFFEQFEHHHNQAHQPPNWLHKRGEVTMKCVKGFLIENSRSGKRVQTDENVFGGGMRNVEFLLPSQAAIYGTGINGNGNGNGNGITATTPTTANAPVTSLGAFRHPQEVEFAFQQSRTLLVNLFRTS